MATFAVIMAGGSGTRFWPASRSSLPKQLLPLSGRGRSLLAETVARLAPLMPPERVLIVTAEKLAEATRREVPQIPAQNVLAEPAPRNTAPCIGWANRTIAARDPHAVVAVLPSDHFVENEPAFVLAVQAALDAAGKRPLATIGITPTRPDTGFGYIETGDVITGAAGATGAEGVARTSARAREVVRFVEKPDLARARAFIESGRFLWNSGMFFFRASEMERAIVAHMPELAAGLDALDLDPQSLATVFPTLPSISIDYGVVERIAASPGNVAVVAGDFGWSDVGSWESTWELATKDDAGNALPEGAIVVDARGNLARTTSGKVVALVGVNDLVVVETADALLVMPRSRAQDVRAVVEALKSSGRGNRT